MTNGCSVRHQRVEVLTAVPSALLCVLFAHFIGDRPSWRSSSIPQNDPRWFVQESVLTTHIDVYMLGGAVMAGEGDGV